MTARLSLDDVERARATIRPYLSPTPLRRSFALRAAGEAYLKLECWQPTGSFKVRGAINTLVSLSPDERRRGIVAASAGNHALGVAFAVQALGGRTDATLFVPETAPRAKVEKLRGFAVTPTSIVGTVRCRTGDLARRADGTIGPFILFQACGCQIADKAQSSAPHADVADQDREQRSGNVRAKALRWISDLRRGDRVVNRPTGVLQFGQTRG